MHTPSAFAVCYISKRSLKKSTYSRFLFVGQDHLFRACSIIFFAFQVFFDCPVLPKPELLDLLRSCFVVGGHFSKHVSRRFLPSPAPKNIESQPLFAQSTQKLRGLQGAIGEKRAGEAGEGLPPGRRGGDQGDLGGDRRPEPQSARFARFLFFVFFEEVSGGVFYFFCFSPRFNGNSPRNSTNLKTQPKRKVEEGRRRGLNFLPD